MDEVRASVAKVSPRISDAAAPARQSHRLERA
jgi:hypothetical protein